MTKIKHKKLKTLLAAIAAGTVMLAASVQAHTVSLGYVPAAAPGEVTFWVGNYTHNVPGNVPNEGSLRLTGVNGNLYPATTTLFNLSQWDGEGGKPVGLADGTNNFYASGVDGVAGSPLVNNFASSYITSCPACGPVTGWQGVNVAGLAAGDYMFEFIEIANPTFEWTEWNDSLNSTFTLGEGDVGGGGPGVIPLPAALPLYGAGLAVLGLLGWRRKCKS
ncbi:MAG: VPLPA-CTERM sorting domain-containing protein [Sneathiella sp.]|nr:VPLPA-CTERM sorting domain-containing protein [Sneathiella sp.]